MTSIDPAERLNDDVLQEEIALLGDVIAAATQAGRPLCQAEVDRALGVDR
ncbi:hypothetical protein [Pedococcus sp. 5OH_020]|nr:hypothetical protein [Pedococcus sp. 5OH_020]